MKEIVLLVILVFGGNGSADSTIIEVESMAQCERLGQSISNGSKWRSGSKEKFLFRTLWYKCVKK